MGATDRLDDVVTTILSVYCPYSEVLTIVFSLSVLFSLVSAGSMLVLSRGDASYVVAMLTIALNAPVVVLLGGFLYLCNRRWTT